MAWIPAAILGVVGLFTQSSANNQAQQNNLQQQEQAEQWSVQRAQAAQAQLADWTAANPSPVANASAGAAPGPLYAAQPGQIATQPGSSSAGSSGTRTTQPVARQQPTAQAVMGANIGQPGAAPKAQPQQQAKAPQLTPQQIAFVQGLSKGSGVQ